MLHRFSIPSFQHCLPLYISCSLVVVMSAMRVVVCSIFVVIVGAKVLVADVVLSMSVVSCARHDIIYMESLQNY